MSIDPNDLQKPCITLPVMLSLCKRFAVLPTYAQMMEQTPGFRLHVLDSNHGKGKSSVGQWSRGKKSALRSLISLQSYVSVSRFLLCCTNTLVR